MGDNKILCSVEPWDSILGVNRPNGTSRTWYYEEKGTPEELYTLTKDIILNGTQQDVVVNSTLFHSLENLEKVEIHEIGDRKHLYIIRVQNHMFFEKNLNIGFRPISPKVLVDVKEGRALIVVECTAEGTYFKHAGTELTVIDRWREKQELPPYSVHVISGNLLAEQIAQDNQLKIHAYGVSTFERSFPIPQEIRQNIDKNIEYKPIDSQNLFLSYNRAQRTHRGFLVAMLNEYNLLKRGKISYQLSNINFDNINPSLYNKQKWLLLKNKGPQYIDNDQVNNLADTLPIEHYEQTFISLVTETTVNSRCIFFSEKIFKPIAVGHPFILLGNPFSLKKLKEMGYRTFDNWIDESYDNITDDFARTIAIVKEIEKLKTLSEDQLKAMRVEMNEVLIHNKKVFYSHPSVQSTNRFYIHIQNEIEKIWEILNQGKPLI